MVKQSILRNFSDIHTPKFLSSNCITLRKQFCLLSSVQEFHENIPKLAKCLVFMSERHRLMYQREEVRENNQRARTHRITHVYGILLRQRCCVCVCDQFNCCGKDSDYNVVHFPMNPASAHMHKTISTLHSLCSLSIHVLSHILQVIT